MSHLRRFFIIYVSIALTSGCRFLNSNGASQPENTIHPEPSEFSSASPKEREKILTEALKIHELRFVKTKFKVPQSKWREWIIEAIAPLNMSRDSLVKHDVSKYGIWPFVSFTKMVVLMLQDNPQNSFVNVSKDLFPAELRDEMDALPDVKLLVQLSSKILNKPSPVRVGENAIADETRLDNVKAGVIDAQYAQLLKTLSIRDFISVYSIPENKKLLNDKGVPFWGSYIMYAKHDELPNLLRVWQKEIIAAGKNFDSTHNEASFIESIARAYVRCVAFHPFSNGNGRTCRLWMVHALGIKNIPHSLMWAGEDFLLPENEFLSRFKEGVRLHRNLIARLSK